MKTYRLASCHSGLSPMVLILQSRFMGRGLGSGSGGRWLGGGDARWTLPEPGAVRLERR